MNLWQQPRTHANLHDETEKRRHWIHFRFSIVNFDQVNVKQHENNVNYIEIFFVEPVSSQTQQAKFYVLWRRYKISKNCCLRGWWQDPVGEFWLGGARVKMSTLNFLANIYIFVFPKYCKYENVPQTWNMQVWQKIQQKFMRDKALKDLASFWSFYCLINFIVFINISNFIQAFPSLTLNM